MKISFIGLGLIGGSMAIRLRKVGFAKQLWGLDQNPDHAHRALELGLVDKLVQLDQLVSESDLIVLSIPVDRARETLPLVMETVPDTTVVMDVGSTKQGICAIARDMPNRELFVASHPIAGTENFGPDAAIPDLFGGKVTILCDTHLSNSSAVGRVEQLYNELGMSILYMGSREHDLHVAYVSHLSHISSFNLGLTVLEIEKSEKAIFDLAGSGFDSTVRLAKSSPEMWAPIFNQNSEYLVEALEAYIDNLNKFKSLIEDRDTTKLVTLMTKANEIRRVLDGQRLTENNLLT